MRYLLDTNVVSEASKSKPHPAVTKWLASVDDDDLVISVLTVKEMAYGAAKAAADGMPKAAAIAAGVESVLESFSDRTIPVDAEVARMHASLLAERHAHIDDTLLAATAAVHGLVLVTRNITHVSGRGVALLNPFKDPPEEIAANAPRLTRSGKPKIEQ